MFDANKLVSKAKTVSTTKERKMIIPEGGTWNSSNQNQPQKTKLFVEDVDPKRCILLDWHDRTESWFTPEGCKDIIDSWRLHGQKTPAIGKPIVQPVDDNGKPLPDDGKSPLFVIIAGARRRFSAEFLGQNLKLIRSNLTDREIAIEQEIENGKDQDVTQFEKALSWQRHISSGRFETQLDLATELTVTNSHVSNLIKAADVIKIPGLVDILKDPKTIQIKEANELIKLIKIEKNKKIALREISSIKEKEKLLDADIAIQFLLDGIKKDTVKNDKKKAVQYKKDWVVGKNESSLNVRINRDGDASFKIKGFRNSDPKAMRKALLKAYDEACG